MYIVYYDESGDDGWPGSSDYFVLTATYLHDSKWREAFDIIKTFRRQLNADYGIGTTTEFHAKYFMLDKKSYRQLHLSDTERIQIIDIFCDLIAKLDVRIINVVIDKGNITDKGYDILDKSLTYSIQRIENDLDTFSADERFLIITDPGREGAMRKTARRIRQINYIPSKISQGTTYRREIKRLIEDPLPKDSKESYFIQICDLVSYIVYMYMIHTTGRGKIHNRMPAGIDANKVLDWMDRLSGSLNTKASNHNKYGIVHYPK